MPRGKRSRSTGWRKVRALRLEDVRHWWMRRLPVLEWVPAYAWKENLVPDAVSGMMLAIQQVTQGLAFAVLSSVHPVFGLYGSFFPAIIYAIFGMGRHVATVYTMLNYPDTRRSTSSLNEVSPSSTGTSMRKW